MFYLPLGPMAKAKKGPLEQKRVLLRLKMTSGTEKGSLVAKKAIS